jgi:hypothetical protein
MQGLKVALFVIAVLLVYPIVFALVYALQVGCLVCLDGEGEGSAAEAWLNLGLVALPAGAAVVWLRNRRNKRRRNKRPLSTRCGH